MRAIIDGGRALALSLATSLALGLCVSACATAPLHTLIEQGRTREAVDRIRQGAELEVWQRSLLPIHAAAQLGQVEVVGALLDAGVEVDAATAGLGRTPLEHAALGGQLPVVELLIERGADVNHRPRDGVRALHLAAEFQRAGVAAALLDAGAEVDARTLEGVTALHHACGNRSGSALAQLETVAALVERGADLGAVSPTGFSIRDAAQQGGNLALRRILRAADPRSGPADSTAVPVREMVVEIERAIALPDAPALAFVAGRASAIGSAGSRLDLVLAIDVSDSTRAPAGFDVDGDGEIGRLKRLGGLAAMLRGEITDREDSVLRAELAAAESLMARLDPETSRLGVVTFSGPRPREEETPAARVVLPLSQEPASWEAALAEVLEAGSWGRTHLAEGLRVAMGAVMSGETGQGREPAIVVFSDGEPTLPVETSRLANARLALGVAEQAAGLGLRIDAVAFGERDVQTLADLAAVAGGTYSRIASREDLEREIEIVAPGPVDRVEIRNRVTGEPSRAVLLQSDGRFAALVPVGPGARSIGVEAWMREGPSRSATARVESDTADLTPRERLERALLARRAAR